MKVSVFSGRRTWLQRLLRMTRGDWTFRMSHGNQYWSRADQEKLEHALCGDLRFNEMAIAIEDESDKSKQEARLLELESHTRSVADKLGIREQIEELPKASDGLKRARKFDDKYREAKEFIKRIPMRGLPDPDEYGLNPWAHRWTARELRKFPLEVVYRALHDKEVLKQARMIPHLYDNRIDSNTRAVWTAILEERIRKRAQEIQSKLKSSGKD